MNDSGNDPNAIVVAEITAIVAAAAAKYVTAETEPASTYEIEAPATEDSGERE